MFNLDVSLDSAYFDEEIEVFISGPSNAGILELQVSYDNGQETHHILNDPIFVDNIYRWTWKDLIKPKSSCKVMNIRAKYSEKEISTFLPQWEEIGDTEFAGLILTDQPSATTSTSTSTSKWNILWQAEHSLSVNSIYRMSMRTVRVNEELWLAWLEISPSRSVSRSGTAIHVHSIDIKADDVILQGFLDSFPFTLNSESSATIPYKLIKLSQSSIIKHDLITCTIKGEIDGRLISTKWITNIDISTATLALSSSPNLSKKYSGVIPNRKLKSASAPTISKRYSTHSGSTLASGSNGSNDSFENKKMSSRRHASFKSRTLSSINSYSSLNSNKKRGLNIQISGPNLVKLGERFRWNLKLHNESTEKMDLIIYVQSSISKTYEKSTPTIPTQSGPNYDTIPLFTNQQLVRNFYHKFNKSGIISLTNHLRVNLDRGFLFETELVLVSIERGIFNLYDLKIVDMISGTTFECGKLLDVFVI
ncbi:hypothetical protein DAMA08_026800 [Martiniozyma asiatica (nom. inval.)]|nr:hypothetical protein DAMA08_026800 [Martiniozyma asiatica]